ncbi:arylsulfatase B [Endozoicomonas montiporae]|uniref:Twin-arginine translocation pathway signal n=1 Tax=Endozoicomonas montiporae CL-33 TaxID=570277 RepID=A0A142BDH1_9GAMM|nr:arylsulfatase [Endozoicomonas montiporae]AMO56797.1 twin-arginine translocation pathway signal [Endozoicomonas montiporae CL-33]
MHKSITHLLSPLVFLSGCFSVQAETLQPSSAEIQPEQPNIIIMVADDIGFADPGFRGSGIETPAIDSLAADGVTMNRFYTAPISSPTRAALMTGRDPIRLGVAYSVVLPWDSGGVHTSEHFMPESFQAAGYQTAMMGKWHLGHSQENFLPNRRGFDYFYGHLHTEVGYYPPFSLLGGKDFQENGKSIDAPEGAEGYSTFLLANKTSEWIKERDKSKPFFLYLPFLAPHEPLEAPQTLIDKYADLKDERGPARSPSDDISKVSKMTGTKSRRPLYAAVVDAMDQAVGKVLKTLDDENIADNTIVMFFSDNGATRVHGRGGGDNAPYRGGKGEVYEGGIRVVSVMRWPDKIKSGTILNDTMTVMDVFPTLTAASRVKPLNDYKLDGINMLPALTEGKTVKRKEPVFFTSEIPLYNSFGYTTIDGDWKLVQWVTQEPMSTSVTQELYNLADDPGEYNDLSSKEPKRVAKMSQQILTRRALHPINGVRARISSPPGWRPPLDWATYPRPSTELQEIPATSMAPTRTSEHVLDYLHDERGRLIYNCEPTHVPFVGGVCIP